MAQSGETGIWLVLAFGTLGMLALAIFIVLFVVLYQKKLLKQQSLHQRELLEATIQVQEKERKRFALELHDGVGAQLSTVKLNISQIDLNIKHGDSHTVNFAKETMDLIDETIATTRRISKDLLPATLEEFGLADALDELCNNINSSSLTVSFQLKGTAKRLEIIVELALYRVMQELMNNSLKHANATRIEIALDMNKAHLNILFSDNGKGFDMHEVTHRHPAQKGLGLKNIESRINMINGSINYDTGRGKGTRVAIELDLK